jgi:sigma-54 dependent transcriptional regulator, acetoin dehydrogenase operon transcriptional activator AcoR
LTTDRPTKFLDEQITGSGRLSENLARRIAELLDDGFVAHDNARRIYLFNDAAERITGRKRAEVLGQDCHDVFPPYGLCGPECNFRTAGCALERRRKYEVTVIAADGEDRHLAATVHPVDPELGLPDGIFAVFRDITEVTDLRRQVQQESGLHGIVAASAAMREVFEIIRQVSSSDYPVLILGESGTGKELVAQAIHTESRRQHGPFVPINCGALPENVLESELFGHVRGAFTGAIRDKKGRFELAHQGTLFLDEVGDLSPAFQVKLLRVLQEKRFERVGGERSITADVRIVSATNQDLRTLMERGTFRDDLYYRLCVVPLRVPPLRERRDDIPLLVEHVLRRVRRETGKDLRAVTDGAMAMLMGHAWPGNVRELINAMQFAAVRCPGAEIGPEHLPPDVRHSPPVTAGVAAVRVEADAPPAHRRTQLTVEAVRDALAHTGGNKLRAAKFLGVGRATLYRFLDVNPLD